MRHPLAAALERVENRPVPIKDANHDFLVTAAAIRAELIELEKVMDKQTAAKTLHRCLEIYKDRAKPTTNVVPLQVIVGHIYDMQDLQGRERTEAELGLIVQEYDAFVASCAAP